MGHGLSSVLTDEAGKLSTGNTELRQCSCASEQAGKLSPGSLRSLNENVHWHYLMLDFCCPVPLLSVSCVLSMWSVHLCLLFFVPWDILTLEYFYFDIKIFIEVPQSQWESKLSPKTKLCATGLFPWWADKRFSSWRCEGGCDGQARLQHCWLLPAELTIWVKEERTGSFSCVFERKNSLQNFKWMEDQTRGSWLLLLLFGGAGDKGMKIS